MGTPHFTWLLGIIVIRSLIYLIDRGAKIDAEDKDKLTPLHFAAQNNSDKVANILIDRGANVNAVQQDSTYKWDPTSLRCCQ